MSCVYYVTEITKNYPKNNRVLVLTLLYSDNHKAIIQQQNTKQFLPPDYLYTKFTKKSMNISSKDQHYIYININVN